MYAREDPKSDVIEVSKGERQKVKHFEGLPIYVGLLKQNSLACMMSCLVYGLGIGFVCFLGQRLDNLLVVFQDKLSAEPILLLVHDFFLQFGSNHQVVI